jgi:hypothetical protein
MVAWKADRGGFMALVVLSDTPNMTSQQYDRVAAELGLSGALPPGCLAHIAGFEPDGSTWRDISVWESGAQAKEFMDTLLRPAMERAGAVPIWGPPTTWELHELIT